MNVKDDQVRVYSLLFDMLIKAVLAVAMLIAFFIVLNYCLVADSLNHQIVLGGLDSILAGTMFVVFRHYFPQK